MPEATILCCDTSEWMRNGDFSPNRFEAQKDACNLVCGTKTQQNRENEVGLIQMGGKGKATVLRNCTTEVGMIWNAAHQMEIKGKANILVALQTAQLALKHRKNKKQSARIIVFVGSPVDVPKKDLIKAAKRLKKNKVAVDIISFGETDANKELLTQFMEKVNSNGNSNLISVPRGSGLSDALLASPICVGQGGAAAAAVGGVGANNDFPGGVDPNMDPDLAMALRLSLEEERERQREAAKQENKAKETGTTLSPVPEETKEGGVSDPVAPVNDDSGNYMDVDDDDEALARAIALSMKEVNDDGDQPTTENADGALENTEADLNNPELIDQLLDDLPGLEKDDIQLDALLDMVGDDKKDEDGDENKDPKS